MCDQKNEILTYLSKNIKLFTTFYKCRGQIFSRMQPIKLNKIDKGIHQFPILTNPVPRNSQESNLIWRRPTVKSERNSARSILLVQNYKFRYLTGKYWVSEYYQKTTQNYPNVTKNGAIWGAIRQFWVPKVWHTLGCKLVTFRYLNAI